MTARRILALPLAACLLVGLGACGEQIPGGTKVEAETSAKAAGSGGTGAEADPKAENPIVVKMGDKEFPTIMAIYKKYDEVKATPLNLQAPTKPVQTIPGGKMQEYAGGTIYWSKATGAHIVRGALLKTYVDNGGPTGKLGYPTTDETTEGTGAKSTFQHGAILLKDQAIQVVQNQ